MAAKRRILVVKLSSLGDFVQALGAMAAIRRHHADDHVTLLTTAPFQSLAERSGLFDAIWLDPRGGPARPDRWLPLLLRLARGGFARIYDLQWAGRTAAYFRALGLLERLGIARRPAPDWVGVVEGCAYCLPDPRARRHIRDRQAALLRLAGIEEVGPPDLSFLHADISRFRLERRYCLLVPGSSPAHRWKRWPVESFIAVARALAAEGIESVLIGQDAEREEMALIAAACPQARSIESNLAEVVELAKAASLAISNDTGPAFLIEAAGCPLVLLYAERSDHVKLAPRGPAVKLLRERSVADIPVEAVLAAGRALIRSDPGAGRERARG